MSACECCWSAKSPFGDASEAYNRELRQHEQFGCVCTKATLEGQRAKAGQFWDDEGRRDKRATR